MDDAKRADAASWKLVHGTRPKVVTPDTTPPRAEKAGGRKKRQEPPCPVNVKGPKLGEMIDDWLTFIRQEVDEQQKRTKSVETADRQPGQSKEDTNGVLVCVYDRQSQTCTNQKRRGTNSSSICSQPAPNYRKVGNNISLTGSNRFVPSNNRSRPSNTYMDPSNKISNPSALCNNRVNPCRFTTGTCSIQSNENRKSSVCSNRQDNVSKNLAHNSITKFGCQTSTFRFQQPNVHHKPPAARAKQARTLVKPPKTVFKLPNTAFDQLQISPVPLVQEKLDTCSSQPNAGYSDPV